MDPAAKGAGTDRRGIVYRLLTLISICLIAAAFVSPGWWVSLTAPNYPEATFPQGIRILFHMDSVRNGCDIRASKEVEENEALDCVHEMDTINHYVGMYPIASGGPVEKAFSPFLFAMMGVMLLAFAAPGRKTRIAVSVLGYGAVIGWMALTLYGENGVQYQTTGYLRGLVVSLGQDTKDKVEADQNLSPIVKMLKQSLEDSAASEKTATATATVGDRQALIDNLKAHYPQLAQSLSPQGYALPRVAALCKALLVERVPLRDFRKIAEAMVSLGSQQLGDGDLVEAVRQRIGALIVQTIVPGRMPLPVVTFSPEIEVLLNQAVRANPGAEWPFEHGMAMKIIEQIGQAVEPLLLSTRSFALVASPLCRSALSRLVRATFPDVAVISYLEIPANKATEIVATIGADVPRLTAGEEAQMKDEPHEN